MSIGGTGDFQKPVPRSTLRPVTAAILDHPHPGMTSLLQTHLNMHTSLSCDTLALSEPTRAESKKRDGLADR